MDRPMNTTDDIVVTPGQGPGNGSAGDLMARMRDRLRGMRPDTDADALQLLRAEFPDSTLSGRVRALSGYRAGG